jgi:hypothetical protein
MRGGGYIHVVMAMRHFPWLHFHMNADGEYVAGESYDFGQQ